jgi:ketosteroid isomerase-like protein
MTHAMPTSTETAAEFNKQVVLQAYAALKAGDVAGYFDRMTSDVTVTYFGSHRFSRTFRGKGDIMENFVPPLLERLEGPIKITVTNVIAEGEQVFVEAQGESRTKDGLDYNNLYGIVLRLRDGKIAEIREYMDTQLTKAIFG